MTLEDSNAFATVLPNSQIMDSEYNYYLFVAGLFRHEYVYYEVKFSKLALQVSPAGVDTGPLWKTIVKGLGDLGLYEEAYATLMQISSEILFVLIFGF
jgi:nuclear pore complex protein Nup160